jgi:Arc/MetJ-type ribon-helix-helix transcriptional regulator
MKSKTALVAVRPKRVNAEGIDEKGTSELTEKISEKITINMGFVDLGQIDLLVSEGFYGNRTDFIRTAIRNQIGTHAEAVKQVVARKTLVLGLQHFSAADLQSVKAAGQTLVIRVLGLVTIANDVSPALALATIESLEVLGALSASPAVKTALRGRIR